MSPSGSRMQIDGTSTAARPFCRRASRNSADGRNTDAAEGFLLARIAVMAVPRRRLEHRSIAIGWHFHQICRAQAACFDGPGGRRRPGRADGASAAWPGLEAGRFLNPKVAVSNPEGGARVV